MGLINRFDLSRIIREYKTPYFFETGTFRGEGVDYALQSPFDKIVSVEIIGAIADEAKIKFNAQNKVEIVEGNSVSALAAEIPKLDNNCVFWLDAHFPGADAGITRYDDNNDESVRLPLQKEIEIISRLRSNFKDVLIIDDLRIYEDGPYQNGNVPPDALPKEDRHIGFIYNSFSASHVILKSYIDEGYILMFPKKGYRINHIKNNLFSKRIFMKDFYLT